MKIYEVPVTKKIHGNPFRQTEETARIYFTFDEYGNSGELHQYQIPDENLDDWHCVPLDKLSEYMKEQLQKQIDQYIADNPDMFDSEPDEAS